MFSLYWVEDLIGRVLPGYGYGYNMSEIDKLTKDYKGDPGSALLDVLDKEQNNIFQDNYIEEEVDLSNVLFITTANDTSSIPEVLKDRLDVLYNNASVFWGKKDAPLDAIDISVFDRILKIPNGIVLVTGPTGSGKSTIINYLMTQNLNLTFSISATSRHPRGTEQHGVEYYFLSAEEFKQRIANDEFLEYEEVYENRFYGTLKAPIEKQLAEGYNVVFDVDVVGGCNIKKYYGNRALSVFIQPPSIEELRKRLVGRATDAPEVIESRIAKAEFELGFADKFDVVVINDELEKAKADTLETIQNFLKS